MYRSGGAGRLTSIANLIGERGDGQTAAPRFYCSCQSVVSCRLPVVSFNILEPFPSCCVRLVWVESLQRLYRELALVCGSGTTRQEAAPNGAEELSPALQRWVRWKMRLSPAGTAEVATPVSSARLSVRLLDFFSAPECGAGATLAMLTDTVASESLNRPLTTGF